MFMFICLIHGEVHIALWLPEATHIALWLPKATHIALWLPVGTLYGF